MKFINIATLNKIRRAASKCHSVLTKRGTFRCRAKVATDSVDRGSLQKVQGHRATQGHRAGVNADLTPSTGGPVGHACR